ncbi:hypothetical protein HQ584_03380 [Patescibacteria group bacterium]|nr:hypothetical protein [Patescibacteria group bacterium]
MPSKMYILVRESVKEKDEGHAVLSVAHASAAACRNWAAEADFDDWANNSFRKVLCLVTDEEFDKAKTYFEDGRDFQIMTESALDNKEISVVFKPREEWPKFFKFLRLWK